MSWRKIWGAMRGVWLQQIGLQELRSAVKAHLPVLPVVSAQLRDASRQVEQAVAQVGGSFERMVERAREGVDEAATLLGDGGDASGGAGVGGMLATSRSTLEDLLARIVQDSGVCRKLVQRMGSLERDMARIVAALADVDKISFANTILALNARIEAAHLGELGKGFEVVAQELWLQAQRSSELTEGIRGTVMRLASDAHAAVQDIGEMACADGTRISALRAGAGEALNRLENMHRDMEQSLAGVGKRHEQLAAEIGQAVLAMQFQDRVSQQIEHIVAALDGMQAAIAAPLGPVDSAPVDHGEPPPAMALLAGSYTMHAERVVHAATLGQQAAGPSESDDVEIF